MGKFSEKLKQVLRGRHNSIRYKYFVLPREWLTYLVSYRLRGRSWIDFYAIRLDGFVAGNDQKPVKQSYLDEGAMHLAYLQRHGLQQHHRLLDYGCGMLRSGLHFTRFLDAHCYVGVDISGHRIDRGIKLLAEHGVSRDSYETHVVSDCHLAELSGQSFDFVWANSVVTHMPMENVRTAFLAVRALLNADGQFFFTYAEAERSRRMNIKDFWYTRDEMHAMCTACGLSFEIQEDWRDMGDVMVCAKRIA